MKKKLRNLFIALLTGTVLLSGCGGSKEPAPSPSGDTGTTPVETPNPDETPAPADTGSGDTIKIGVASNNFNDKWQTYMLDAIRDQGVNYPEYEFIFANANEDANTQIGQVENFINNGVAGIILVAVNTDTAGPMTSACKDAGIPLVTVNRILENQDDATAYVGSESIEAGIQAAEIAFEKSGGQGKVAVLMGPAGNESAIMRTAGYQKVQEEKYPDVEFVAEEIGNWNRDEAISITENWLQSGLDFNIILSNNDEMAVGAILALEGQGVRDDYIVVGVDATIDALEVMKEGRLDGTVYQSAIGQGTAAVDTMIQAIEGTLTEDRIWIPFEPVTPDKVDEYISKWE